jgi:hypothetical protein
MMVIGTWIAARYVPGGHLTFLGIKNLFMKRNFGTNGAIKYILYTINIAINITA